MYECILNRSHCRSAGHRLELVYIDYMVVGFSPCNSSEITRVMWKVKAYRVCGMVGCVLVQALEYNGE